MLKGRKVLVTGAGGFIGSALTERLVRDGADVRAFVRYNSRNEHGWLEDSGAEVRSALEVVAGDLKDPEAVRRAVAGCEVVFHLGALIAIPYSYVHPLDFVQTNVVGTAHVLDACRDLGVERLVHTSTSEVYGNAEHFPIDESQPAVARSPYAASKVGADQLALSYFGSFELPVTIARPFNTYGPRQSARAIVGALVAQFLSGSAVKLGSLHPTRDLTYVDDTVDGFVRLATAEGAVGQVVNLGSGREISIGDLAEKVRRLADAQAPLEQDAARVRPAGSEVLRLCADRGRAGALLGWEPRVSLEEGLRRTIAWFEKHLGLYKTHLYNV